MLFLVHEADLLPFRLQAEHSHTQASRQSYSDGRADYGHLMGRLLAGRTAAPGVADAVSGGDTAGPGSEGTT